MKLNLNEIVFDEELRPRLRIDPIAVHRYVTAYEAGAQFDPVTVEAETYRLVDGWIRCAAYEKLGIATIEVHTKTYVNDGELFADAVRLNVGHGFALQSYDLKRAIARLTEYGLAIERIVEIVRIPAPRIEDIVRGFAQDQTGSPVPLKRGLEHLRDQPLTDRQVAAVQHHGGHMGTFYARQLHTLIVNNMWPRDNPVFVAAMDDLVAAWNKVPRAPRAA